MERAVLAAALLGAAIFAPCLLAPGPALAQDRTVAFTGEALIRERIALPPETEVAATLREAGGGMPAAIVATTSEPFGGRQVPVPFRLEIPAARLVDGTPYALLVGIMFDGEVRWRSAPITVEPAADGVDVGEVLLRAHEPLAFATSLLCGDVPVRFGVEDDRATLEVGGERFPMTRTRTASGARYEAEDDPQTFVWQKGEEATVEVRGTALPPCRVLDEPVSGRDVLPGAEWAVETVNGAAALDAPSATVEFTAEGGLSGRASCNRYSTAYAVNGPFIAVDPRVAVTQMACPPPVLDQERAVLDVLAEARTWSLDPDGALLVETADGRALTARRAEAAPE